MTEGVQPCNPWNADLGSVRPQSSKVYNDFPFLSCLGTDGGTTTKGLTRHQTEITREMISTFAVPAKARRQLLERQLWPLDK